jgi:hypothetical protein
MTARATAQLGGGKYDPELRQAQASTHAGVVVLIVVGGDRGDGFALAVDESWVAPADALSQVPGILRAIAESVDEKLRMGAS